MALIIAALVGFGEAVSSASFAQTVPSVRRYRMGFSFDMPPLPTVGRYFERFNLWSARADGSITHNDIPWEALLQGESPEAIVRRQLLPPMTFMRARDLAIVITLEPLNGLDRTAEAAPLRIAGRSITEPGIQRLYRDYALAVVRLIEPDYLGLAAEVNMFRAYGSTRVYEALVQMVQTTATDLRALRGGLPLYVSAQVDTAWGRDGNQRGYEGVRRTVADFPAIDALGLSTYPMLAWETPGSIPTDYFSRLLEEAGRPGLVSESGWPSLPFRGKPTSAGMQAEWIRTLARLADAAPVVFVGQLLFSDIDESLVPIPPDSILPFFVSQGLVDRHFEAKPALAEWDRLFQRPYRVEQLVSTVTARRTR